MAIFNKFQRAKQVAEILLRYGLDEFFERSNLESGYRNPFQIS
jgi:hypothetical protein